VRIRYAEEKALYTRHGAESCQASSRSAVWYFPGVEREWLRWGGSLSRGERRWEQVTAVPSPVWCCREGSAEHPGLCCGDPPFGATYGPVTWAVPEGSLGALWPPPTLRRAAAAALRFHLAVKHQNCCWPQLLPAGSQPLLAASLF